MNFLKKLFSSFYSSKNGDLETINPIKENKISRPIIKYHTEGIIDIHLKSDLQHIDNRMENKNYTISCKKVKESPKIYEVFIFDDTEKKYILEPVNMKVYEFEVVKSVVRGMYQEDNDNLLKKESSHLYINFMLNAFGRVGTAVFFDENSGKTIVYQSTR